MSEVVNVGGDYYISDIYNCGMLFSWVMSVCPSGAGLENVHSTVSRVVNVGGGEPQG